MTLRAAREYVKRWHMAETKPEENGHTPDPAKAEVGGSVKEDWLDSPCPVCGQRMAPTRPFPDGSATAVLSIEIISPRR